MGTGILTRKQETFVLELLKGKTQREDYWAAYNVLQEIERIAQDDISNYLDFRTEKTVVGYDNGEPIFDYRTIVEMKDSRMIDTKNVAEVSVGVNGAFKFKNYSRDTALYKLTELLGESQAEAGRRRTGA